MYASLAEFKTWLELPVEDDELLDHHMEPILMAADRWIDQQCGRHFGLEEEATKVYNPSSADVLDVIDLTSVTTIKLDTRNDRSYATTLTASWQHLGGGVVAGALEVKVVGLTPLQGRLASAPAQLESETRKAMTTGLLLFEGEMRRLAPRDTGRLQGSIHHTITGAGANLTGRVGPSVAYGYWVEYGRRAGRQPPIGAISGWARRHGANPFVLARAIGRHGTRKQPFVQPAFIKHASAVKQMFNRVGAQMAAYIAGGK
jgi:hypothetical protein